jgi:plasmid stability protein
MAAVTIRNLSEEAHRALKVRAARHGRSTEAEIREILEETARPEKRPKIGSELAAFGRRLRLNLEPVRDPAPIEPASFE